MLLLGEWVVVGVVDVAVLITIGSMESKSIFFSLTKIRNNVFIYYIKKTMIVIDDKNDDYIYIYYHNNLCIMYLDMRTHRGEAQDGDDKYVLVHMYQ